MIAIAFETSDVPSIAVQPFSRTRETSIMCAACRTSNHRMGSLRLISPFVLISNAAHSVLTKPITS